MLDSGASALVRHADFVKAMHVTKDREIVCNTVEDNVTTGSMCNIKFSLPEFTPIAAVNTKHHVSNKKRMLRQHDVIMRRGTYDRVRINHMLLKSMCEAACLPLRKSHEVLWL